MGTQSSKVTEDNLGIANLRAHVVRWVHGKWGCGETGSTGRRGGGRCSKTGGVVRQGVCGRGKDQGQLLLS